MSPDYFGALDALSRTHGLPFYAHMLETRLQRVLGQTRFGGRSLVRLTADLGFLSERMNLIHGIWVDDADLDLIAEAGTVVAHNPISNLRLGSGVMRFRDLRDRGIPICLGSDEAIADDAVNMWGVAKVAGLVHNLADDDWERWPRAHEVLDCLIRGGARAMGATDRLGAIEPGREADLILVDLDTLAFTPLNDVARQLVYCENGSSVRLAMVAGRIVQRDGVVAGIDERALRAEARSIFAERRSALDAARAAADRWMPHYRAMMVVPARSTSVCSAAFPGKVARKRAMSALDGLRVPRLSTSPPPSTTGPARRRGGERRLRLATGCCRQFRVVLRRPVEITRYLSIRYTERLADAGVVPSAGSVGDSDANALAETINGLYKAEVIYRRGPWRSLEAVEYATLEWVDWFNDRQLLELIGNIPPAEAEQRLWYEQEQAAVAAASKRRASDEPGAVHSPAQFEDQHAPFPVKSAA